MRFSQQVGGRIYWTMVLGIPRSQQIGTAGGDAVAVRSAAHAVRVSSVPLMDEPRCRSWCGCRYSVYRQQRAMGEAPLGVDASRVRGGRKRIVGGAVRLSAQMLGACLLPS